jgi:hypothetical protein
MCRVGSLGMGHTVGSMGVGYHNRQRIDGGGARAFQEGRDLSFRRTVPLKH